MATRNPKQSRAVGLKRLSRLEPSWRRAFLSPAVAGLIVLLLGQAAAALILASQDLNRGGPRETPLLNIAPQQVQSIELSAKDETLRLVRAADGWVLPGLSAFPADRDKANALLNALSQLRRSLPVASSTEARTRLKVADDNARVRIALTGSEGRRFELLTGDSPGFRRLYGRIPGEDSIYDLPLAGFQLATHSDDWVQRGKLRLDADSIDRIKTADWTLSRANNGWRFENDPRRLDQDKADALVRRIANLGYQGVETPSSDDAASTTAAFTPALRLVIELADGRTEQRLISASKDGRYLLSTADGRWQYRLSTYDLDGILDAGPDTLEITAAPETATTSATEAVASAEPTDKSMNKADNEAPTAPQPSDQIDQVVTDTSNTAMPGVDEAAPDNQHAGLNTESTPASGARPVQTSAENAGADHPPQTDGESPAELSEKAADASAKPAPNEPAPAQQQSVATPGQAPEPDGRPAGPPAQSPRWPYQPYGPPQPPRWPGQHPQTPPPSPGWR